MNGKRRYSQSGGAPVAEAERVFPAGDLSGLLHAIEERELELEAQNLELRQSTLQTPVSSEQIARLYESARVGYVDLSERGVIENINPAAAAMLRRAPSELVGKRFLQFVAGADVEAFLRHLEECRETSQRISSALRLQPALDSTVEIQFLCMPASRDAQRQTLRLVMADITSVKRAEEKILRLASFSAFNPNPILEFAADGSLTWFNDAALELARLLGFDHPNAIIPPTSARLVQECLATGKSRLRHESTAGDRHLYWSFFPIPARNVVHCYGTDITERLNLEARLRQSQKLESVGQLAAGLAHDFNNVLTIIQGYTSLMLSQRELLPEMGDPLRQIANAAERAGNLTRQLMAFSRKQVLQPQPLDLNEAIQSIAFLLRRLLGESITQQFSFAPGLPLIQADAGMLEQVIMNFVLNARDAMPKGGRLSVSTAAVEITPEHVRQNPEAKAGPFVCLSIADSGQGMDPETQSRIFEPFFTTKKSGLGLGLSTVYGIVRQHQGWIEVSSAIGKGSAFKVFLPAMTAPARAQAPAKAEAAGGNETILVVEDEPVLRELVVRQLRKQGYRIFHACSGTEALALWPQHGGEIDLLFTDIVMPDNMTGRDLAETLIAQKPELKVLYTSGYSLEVIEQEFALRKGANFLQKPYQPETLTKIIRSALDGRKVNS